MDEQHERNERGEGREGCEGSFPVCDEVATGSQHPSSLDSDDSGGDLRGWAPISSSGSWPSARGYSTAVVHGRRNFYTFGGSAGSSRKNDLWLQRNDTWTLVETKGERPSQRNSHSAVIWRDNIIVFGGWDGSRNCNDLYFFDIPKSQWRAVAPGGAPPKCRRGHSAVVTASAMYVFGGWDGGRNFSDLHKLSLSRAWLSEGGGGCPKGGGAETPAQTPVDAAGEAEFFWSPVLSSSEAKPAGRRGHSCVLAGDGTLLLFGGQDGNNFYNDVHSFQEDGATWTQEACSGTPPLPRSYHAAAAFRAGMYVFGGTGATWSFFNDLHLLQVAGKAWSTVHFTGAVPSPRCFHTAAVVGNRLLVFGGARLARDTWDYFNHLYYFLLTPPDGFVNDADECTSLASDLGHLLASEDFADVTFVVEGQPVRAHKALLSSRCDYFRHMLHSGMSESRLEHITLPDIRHSVFKSLLQYLYTDTVTPAPDLAVDLLSLASRYGMDGLKGLLEQRITASIRADNVSLILVAADTHAAAQLKRVCMDFILKEFGRVIRTESFMTLATQQPLLAREVLALASHNLSFSFR